MMLDLFIDFNLTKPNSLLSSILSLISPIILKYFLKILTIQMNDDSLENEMIITLKQAIEWADNRENQLLNDVLSLEKKINRIHDTKPVVRKR